MVKYLIGRFSDPIFGVVTGVAAYILWENDPRNAQDHGNGNSLLDLISRRLQIENPVRKMTHSMRQQLQSRSPETEKRII
ncbi:Uncharacterized protein MSYG_0776 [Malassezia sympodialis ATCC 42132]|uniref:Uncharacterized protein n=1 Tax=Malassezia sympodialis (strain ATCC 42132) TaxID=1230383 RepID=A0A1M8A1Z2_MALS4|nr:Uncharacterized protein MSYG_0776 [Malassezia sympodialis ATCC 42132]